MMLVVIGEEGGCGVGRVTMRLVVRTVGRVTMMSVVLTAETVNDDSPLKSGNCRTVIPVSRRFLYQGVLHRLTVSLDGFCIRASCTNSPLDSPLEEGRTG